MEAVASVIAVIQLSSSVANLCWQYRKLKKASKAAARIIEQLNSLDAILKGLVDLLEDDGAPTERRFHTTEALRKSKQLGDLQSLLEGLETKLQPPHGLEKLLFPLKTWELDEALQEIRRLESTLQLALQVDQMHSLSTIAEDFQRILETQTAVEQANRRRAIMKWLAPPDYETNHNTIRDKHVEDTGECFVKGHLVERWKWTPSSLLWLHGIAGCGKSFLSFNLIESLMVEEQSHVNMAVAYFYFEFSDADKRTVDSMVRSLISQLERKSKTPCQDLDDLFEEHYHRRQPPLSMLLAVLRRQTENFSQTFIVLDAIDESESVEDVLDFIQGVCKWEVPGLHTFVSSRLLLRIEEALKETTKLQMAASEDLLRTDIDLYIHHEVDRLSHCNTQERTEIAKLLLEKTEGMFRLAACQLDLLRECGIPNERRKLLESMPQSLEQFYGRTLLGIPEAKRPGAFRVLEWLAFSVRPVRIKDLAEVLAVELHNHPRYDPGNKDALIHRSAILNSSLIATSPVCIANFEEDQDYYSKAVPTLGADVTEVRLAHASVKDYLLASRIRNSRVAFFALNTKLANQSMAQTCLLYLLHSPFREGLCSQQEQEERLAKWPLLLYASHFWPHHVNELHGDLEVGTLNLIQQLFASKERSNCGNFGAWIISLIPSASLEMVADTEPLYYASSFGMAVVVRKILEEPSSASKIDKRGGRFASTPLRVAIYRGYLDVVKILLNAGANKEILSDVWKSSALFSAISRGYLDIAALLVRYGAQLLPEEFEDVRRLHSPPCVSWPEDVNAMFGEPT